MKNNSKKTAREIKISKNFLKNKNLNIKVGTVEDRNSPETIYIFVSFWIKPKHVNEQIKSILEKELDFIYKQKIVPEITNNFYFPDLKNNIFIKNIPENINYNDKRNFISFEVYLHTINTIKQDKKYPLSTKKDKELFDEAQKIISSFETSDFLNNNKDFIIFSKS